MRPPPWRSGYRGRTVWSGRLQIAPGIPHRARAQRAGRSRNIAASWYWGCSGRPARCASFGAPPGAASRDRVTSAAGARSFRHSVSPAADLVPRVYDQCWHERNSAKAGEGRTRCHGHWRPGGCRPPWRPRRRPPVRRGAAIRACISPMRWWPGQQRLAARQPLATWTCAAIRKSASCRRLLSRYSSRWCWSRHRHQPGARGSPPTRVMYVAGSGSASARRGSDHQRQPVPAVQARSRWLTVLRGRSSWCLRPRTPSSLAPRSTAP